jgi:protein O-mannosyl-transferase
MLRGLGKRATLAALAAVVAVYVALFAPSASYGFVWDDVATLATGDFFERPLAQVLRATEHARMDESITAMRGVSVGHESYRPINVATHWLDVRLFGHRPGPMHVQSMLWGLLGILLAYALAARLLGDAWALVVALLFAVHPAHVEPFAYISARADVVSGAFTLLSALLVVLASPPLPGDAPPSGRGRTIFLTAAACLALLLALFAKEAAAVLPLALLVLAVALGKTRAWAPALVLLALTVALHFPLRALLVPAAPLAQAVTAGGFVARTPGIVLQYLQMLVLPLAISNARPLAPALFVTGWVLAGVALLGLTAAWLSARLVPVTDPRRRDVGLVVAGLLWAALFVAPAGIAVITLGALADRYAYLPLFGFAVAVAVALRRLAGWQPVQGRLVRGTLLGLAVLWVAALLFVSFRERGFWQNNRALYTHAVAVEPESPIAHYRLGVVLGGEGRWPQAAAAFARAADLKQGPMAQVAPAWDRVLNNLGVAHLNLGQTEPAERAFRRAISESNNVSYRAWFNLAKVLGTRGDVAGACHALREALEISPRYELARAAWQKNCSSSAPPP